MAASSHLLRLLVLVHLGLLAHGYVYSLRASLLSPRANLGSRYSQPKYVPFFKRSQCPLTRRTMGEQAHVDLMKRVLSKLDRDEEEGAISRLARNVRRLAVSLFGVISAYFSSLLAKIMILLSSLLSAVPSRFSVERTTMAGVSDLTAPPTSKRATLKRIITTAGKKVVKKIESVTKLENNVIDAANLSQVQLAVDIPKPVDVWEENAKVLTKLAGDAASVAARLAAQKAGEAAQEGQKAVTEFAQKFAVPLMGVGLIAATVDATDLALASVVGMAISSAVADLAVEEKRKEAMKKGNANLIAQVAKDRAANVVPEDPEGLHMLRWMSADAAPSPQAAVSGEQSAQVTVEGDHMLPWMQGQEADEDGEGTFASANRDEESQV